MASRNPFRKRKVAQNGTLPVDLAKSDGEHFANADLADAHLAAIKRTAPTFSAVTLVEKDFAEANPAEADRTEARPADVHATEVHATEVHATEVHATDANAIRVDASLASPAGNIEPGTPDRSTDLTRRALMGRAMVGVPLALAGTGWQVSALAKSRNNGIRQDVSAAVEPEFDAPVETLPTIPLWPAGAMPGVADAAKVAAIGRERVSAKGSVRRVGTPRLRVYRAGESGAAPDAASRQAAQRSAQSTPAPAVLVIAGGGYAHIECGNESSPACRWLQSLGITAFELIYRLPGDGWVPTAPLQDGQRAMRVIRAQAAQWGIDPDKLAVMGFSAGGHLAGTTAATPDVNRYSPVDAVDTQSSQAALAMLLYPVITLMAPFDNTHTRRSILAERRGDPASHASAGQAAALSVDHHITGTMPPVFVAQATDDPISPVDNSLLLYGAMRAVQRPVEMHLFQSGGHGWGMGKPGTDTVGWPALVERWARLNHFLPA